MTLIEEPLPGLKLFRPFAFADSRGRFVKTFHENQLAGHGIEMQIREEFFSTSQAGVLRGMHFQLPPHDHQKIVFCLRGSVLDVVLDLRASSPSFGHSASFELSEENHHIAYIPSGFAHGFLSLKENSTMVYKTDTVYSQLHDTGVLWNSFGFEWPLNNSLPVISDRDLLHASFVNFKTPFK